jgi:hypothetical protein
LTIWDWRGAPAVCACRRYFFIEEVLLLVFMRRCRRRSVPGGTNLPLRGTPRCFQQRLLPAPPVPAAGAPPAFGRGSRCSQCAVFMAREGIANRVGSGRRSPPFWSSASSVSSVVSLIHFTSFGGAQRARVKAGCPFGATATRCYGSEGGRGGEGWIATCRSRTDNRRFTKAVLCQLS